MKKKVLFLIHDLGQGGAEKVLVNLVNHMDRSQFDITVMSLFGGGVNESFLAGDIRYLCAYKKMIPANSKWMKLYSPEQLHKKYIKDKYDIEVSFLEGPSARVISGCPDSDTKLISWIHCTMSTKEAVSASFRNYSEAERCYNRMETMVFVSEDVRDHFLKNCSYTGNTAVLHNVLDSESILQSAEDETKEISAGVFKLIGMGTLKPVKGFDRLLNILNRLTGEGYSLHLYLLGDGPLRSDLEHHIQSNHLENAVTLLGYQTNPYKYLRRCDLFVCSSYSEGLSTAVTESLILGVPVCTTDVSGMKDLLDNGESGMITENSEEGLYRGIKAFLDDRNLLEMYKEKAAVKGVKFKTETTVKAIEDLFLS